MRGAELLLVACSVCLVACDPEGSASLEARLESPSLTVDSSAVGADLAGGFSVALELGEYATGPATVALGTFGIRQNGADVLSSLALAGDGFPVTLAAGEARTLRLDVEDSVALDAADALCAGGVSFVGSLIETSSNDKPIAVASSSFDPTCQ